MSPLPIDLGDGVTLRRLTLDDLPAIWALVDAERDRLRAWLPWVDTTRTIDDQRAWVESVLAHERNVEGVGMFCDGAYVGGIGLTIDEFRVVGEIGYWIGSAWEGRGIARRATRAMIDLGFRELGLHLSLIHI